MRARYAARLLAGLLLCLAPLAAAAQAPGFDVDLVTRRAPSGEARLDVLTAVPYPALQFLARTDGYRAAYAVTVDVREADEDGRPGRLVLSRAARHEVEVLAYGATQDGGAASETTARLDVPPGRYAVAVTVEDEATGRAARREALHTVRDVAGPVALSDPLLLRTYDAEAGAGAPIVGAVVSTEAEAFWVACDVYAEAPAALRVTYVVTERSRVRERPSFRDLIGMGARADLGTPVAVTEPLAVAAGRTPAAFQIRAADLDVGDYALVVRLETAGGAVLDEAERSFAVRWTGLDRQLADLDEAVAQLRYVARESELEAIQNAPSPAERLRLFRQFWSTRDPSPGTPRNERMEEYYVRVASANERWGRARASGWSTDPGEVFIRFGEPDEVEEHEATYGTRAVPGVAVLRPGPPVHLLGRDRVRRLPAGGARSGTSGRRCRAPGWRRAPPVGTPSVGSADASLEGGVKPKGTSPSHVPYPMRTWSALLACALCPAALAQDVTVVSEPADDYLLEITREWSARSRLGDLRTETLGDEDVELRLWGGYGLFGTRAVVLRRTDGNWEGFTVGIERYTAAETDSLAAAVGALPPCVVGRMSDRCTVEEVEYHGDAAAGTLYQLECLRVRRDNQFDETYAALWTDVVEAGALALPPEVERDWMMLDGHSYVVEVRVGNEYRASSIEHTEPEGEADRQVQEIARLVSRVLGAQVYPTWQDEE